MLGSTPGTTPVMRINRLKDSLPYKEGKTLTLIFNQALPEEESLIEIKIVRFI